MARAAVRGRVRAMRAAARLAVCSLVTGALATGPAAGQVTGSPEPTTADPRLREAIEWYTGVAGRVDDDLARALLLEAAEDGTDAMAVMWVARAHSRGRMGFSRDEPRARRIALGVFDRIRSLAASGDVEAMFLMGTAYDEGLGPELDHAEALRWYRRAAARGHVLAAHNVGNVFRDGRGVEVDHAAAARWWLRAARAGDVIPALRLGEAFEAGRGVARSPRHARFWYGRAAAAGNEDAARELRRLSGDPAPASRPASLSPTERARQLHAARDRRRRATAGGGAPCRMRCALPDAVRSGHPTAHTSTPLPC